MLRHHVGDGVTLRLFLQLAVDPSALGAVEDCVNAGLVRSRRTVVEIGRVGEARKEERETRREKPGGRSEE
jgi:hypothetical protein